MLFVRFIKFVELSTKLVSVLAFFTGLAYTVYAYGAVNWQNTLLFFISMLLFDMATTAINNFVDKRAEGAKPHFSTPVSLLLLALMLGLSTALGLVLVLRCGIIVLIVGMFCFGMGFAYTLGPAPISRTPYGELFSGTVMGLAIPFLTVYVNLPRQALLSMSWEAPLLSVQANVWPLFSVLAISFPCVAATANIMLANNICDVEKDILVKRYTLPHHIGRPNALRLFAAIYLLIALSVPVLVLLRIAPPFTLLSLLAGIPVYKNTRQFLAKQVKAETFILAVKNFAVINAAFPLTLLLGALVR